MEISGLAAVSSGDATASPLSPTHLATPPGVDSRSARRAPPWTRHPSVSARAFAFRALGRRLADAPPKALTTVGDTASSKEAPATTARKATHPPSLATHAQPNNPQTRLPGGVRCCLGSRTREGEVVLQASCRYTVVLRQAWNGLPMRYTGRAAAVVDGGTPLTHARGDSLSGAGEYPRGFGSPGLAGAGSSPGGRMRLRRRLGLGR